MSTFKKTKSGLWVYLKRFFNQHPLVVIAVIIMALGTIATLFSLSKSQDIRQQATVSCATFSSRNVCDNTPGCNWDAKSCTDFSATIETCNSASGCSPRTETVNCSDLNQTECGNTDSDCYWQWGTASCNMTTCDLDGCSLDTISVTHSCSLDDNNCSQAGCDYTAASCSGSYSRTDYTCTGSHVCEGTSPCSSYSSESSCNAHCCSWTPSTAILSCAGLSQSTCTDDDHGGCSWNPPSCSGSYVTNKKVCNGSYQTNDGSCKGGTTTIQVAGTCIGSYTGNAGSCEGTIIVPTSTPTPIPTATPTDVPDATPTPSYEGTCKTRVYGTCPEGFVSSSDCEDSCGGGMICCERDLSSIPTVEPTALPTNTPTPTPPDGVCEYGAFACFTETRCVRCIYQNGNWGYFDTNDSRCPSPCGAGTNPTTNPTVSLTKIPTVSPTATVSRIQSFTVDDCHVLVGEDVCPVGNLPADCHSYCSLEGVLCCQDISDEDVCERGERECSDDDQYRYCVIDSSTGVNGQWSNWYQCDSKQTCVDGFCLHPTSSPDPDRRSTNLVGATITPSPQSTPTLKPLPSPTPTIVPTATPSPTSPVASGIHILIGESSCPLGTVENANYGDVCSNSNVLCCQDISDEDVCERGERECSDDDQYRYCVIDSSTGVNGQWSNWYQCGDEELCEEGVCTETIVYQDQNKANFEECNFNSECQSGFCDSICMPNNEVDQVTDYGSCRSSDSGSHKCIKGVDDFETDVVCQDLGDSGYWWVATGNTCLYPGYGLIPEGYETPSTQALMEAAPEGIVIIFCYPGISDPNILKSCEFLNDHGFMAMTHEDYPLTTELSCFPNCQIWNPDLAKNAAIGTIARILAHENVHNRQAANAGPDFPGLVSGEIDENYRRQQDAYNKAFQALIEGEAERYPQPKLDENGDPVIDVVYRHVGNSAGYAAFRAIHADAERYAEKNGRSEEFKLAAMGHYDVFYEFIEDYASDAYPEEDDVEVAIEKVLNSFGFRET